MQLLKSEFYELPNKYNQTIIRLLVQSPTRMFVYWEVSDDTAKTFSKEHFNYADCTPVLKVTNITKSYSYLIPVDPFANNYYIEVEDSGCKYGVELGRIYKEHYFNIYTSNVATVPNAHPIKANISYTDEILFTNYLCISDKKRVKVFGTKERYNRFVQQNHTDFENNSYVGSSDNLYH